MVLDILKHDKIWGGQFALLSPLQILGTCPPVIYGHFCDIWNLLYLSENVWWPASPDRLEEITGNVTQRCRRVDTTAKTDVLLTICCRAVEPVVRFENCPSFIQRERFVSCR